VEFYGSNNSANKPGPIFGTEQGGSLIWNGATTILPTTISCDYVHGLFDGTIFYVDSNARLPTPIYNAFSGPHDRDRQFAQFGSGTFTGTTGSQLTSTTLKYGSHHKRDKCITITLPPGNLSHGRLLKYKRIDCDDYVKVNIRADCTIEGEKEICLGPLDSLKIHNQNGRWWILGKYKSEYCCSSEEVSWGEEFSSKRNERGMIEEESSSRGSAPLRLPASHKNADRSQATKNKIVKQAQPPGKSRRGDKY
jgi:hypothetical protein